MHFFYEKKTLMCSKLARFAYAYLMTKQVIIVLIKPSPSQSSNPNPNNHSHRYITTHDVESTMYSELRHTSRSFECGLAFGTTNGRKNAVRENCYNAMRVILK